MKTSELSGQALDWAVAKCEGREAHLHFDEQGEMYASDQDYFDYSIDWSQGGPLIEREYIKISPYHNQGGWWAEHAITQSVCEGPTPLIAAMRCYVASKLGDDVEIPKEFLPRGV